MSLAITINSIIVLFTISAAAPEESRIFGGHYAKPGQFPFQVYLSLLSHKSFFCGGSIYNEKYIITAAHCIVQYGVPVSAQNLIVTAGTISLSNGGIKHSVKRVIPHDNYQYYGSLENDIALLELSSPLIFNKFVQPIELYTGNLKSDENVIISGFGLTYYGGSSSQKLKYNDLTKLIPYPNCEYADKRIICIAHEKDNGACSGDSGGPAILKGKLVGVGSFVSGYGCGTKEPDGYTSVPYYIGWIKQKTSK